MNRKIFPHKINLRVVSWAFYDFANTIFSMNIITLYFALWVTVDKGGRDIYYSIAFSLSMLIAAVLEPVLGAFSDKVGLKKPFLAFFTFLCCIFTALIGMFDTLLYGLMFFVVANTGFQLANVFYNALMSRVSKQENIGRVSGFGVGLGYVGSILGLLMVKPFVSHFGTQGAFVPTGILFFIFALPCLLLVREEKADKVFSFENFLEHSTARIHETLGQIRQNRNIQRIFLLGAFFLSAVYTIILFMGVYSIKVMGFGQNEIITFFIVCSFFSIASAFVFGQLIDRANVFNVFKGILLLWIVGLMLAVLAFQQWIFWIAGAVIGVCLSATWVLCRVMIIQLSPEEKLGEYFGIFGLLSKFSAMIGSLLWGCVVWGFEFLGIFRYKIAIGIQILFVALALWMTSKVNLKILSKGQEDDE